MHDVFISYSSKDKKIADGICANLEANSIRCWYAPRDITPGTEWSEAIMNALSKSKVFVLIFSKNSNLSDQVYNEITSAAKFGCRIIPFCVENIEMKDRIAYYLNAVHWLDATTVPVLESIEALYNEVCAALQIRKREKFIWVPFKFGKKYLLMKTAIAVLTFVVILCVGLLIGILNSQDKPADNTVTVAVGDIIEFGTLEDEPIEWIVLDTQGERVLVISKEGLCYDWYSGFNELCTWDACSLRSALNTDYYDLWFSDDEKDNILETHLVNNGNPVYGTEGGSSTHDRLFILDVEEINKYLPDADDRKINVAGKTGYGDLDYHPWWVRNPGQDLHSSVYVDADGSVSYETTIEMIMGVGTAMAGYFTVRPAMWIKYEGKTEDETPASAQLDYSVLKKAEQGDVVQFGAYEQDNNTANGKEIIDWVVLETKEIGTHKTLTLISRDCLDTVAVTSYNYGYNYWYDSTAREWLNNSFYFDAFSSTERQKMESFYTETSVDGENIGSSDKVIFLSVEEFNSYAHIPQVKSTFVTPYAEKSAFGCDRWWLRDLYESDIPDANYSVTLDGEVKTYMQKFGGLVRPVIKISIDTE